MTNVMLTNDFHGTEVTVRPRIVRGNMLLTHSQMLRVRRHLCGMSDCRCSGIAGVRGGEHFVAEWSTGDHATENMYIVENSAWTE